MELRLVNETRTIVLAQAGMQANQFASVIDHADNITNFTENHTGKSFFFPQDSKIMCSSVSHQLILLKYLFPTMSCSSLTDPA